MGQCESGVVLIATCYLNKFKKNNNNNNEIFVSLVLLKFNIN